MALAPTNKAALSGGLRDSSVEAALQNFIPEIWGAAIQDYMEKKLIGSNLATDMSALVSKGGDRIHIPKHTELTTAPTYAATDAGSVTGAAEYRTENAIGFTKSTAAEGEYVLDVDQSFFSAVAITDIANTQSSYDVMNIYTKKLGYALAKRIELYLMNLLQASVSYNYNDGTDDGVAVGNLINFTSSANREVSKAGIVSMLQTIIESDADVSDYTAVLTPECYASIVKLDDFARYDVLGSAMEAPRVTCYVGKLAGVNVVVSNCWADNAGTGFTTTPMINQADTSNEPDHLAGILLHNEGLHVAYAPGMKSRVQSDYNLETLSTRFVADTVFGATVTSDGSNNKRVFALIDA